MKKIKWMMMQPLIGGMCLGAQKALGTWPEFIISYKGFQANDGNLTAYIEKLGLDIPYLILNADNTFDDPKHEQIFNERNKDIDLAVAVPICSGLSMLNSKARVEGPDAVQNDNMYTITKFILGTIKPKAYIFENAPGLYTNMGIRTRAKLIQFGEDFDYSSVLYKTTTLKHGVPQDRQRTFYFYFDSKTAPIISSYDKPTKNFTDYINEVSDSCTQHLEADSKQRPLSLENEFYFKFMNYKHPGEDFRKICLDHNCKSVLSYINKENLYQEAITFATENNDTRNVRILNKDLRKLADGKRFWDDSIQIGREYTGAIVGRCMYRLTHPTKNRMLTIRELMHMMGLPSDFELVDIKNVNMIAQNVPVHTAKDMVSELIKYLNNELEFSDERVLMINNISDKVLEKQNKLKTLIKENERSK